jgi:vacuolar-type H+-ATPase subunit E/Vma4
MSIDALLLHLEEDAMGEAARLKGAAEARAAEIVARAEADVARHRALHLERITADRRSAGQRQVAAARAEARERFLRSRADVLGRVFDRASAQLEATAAGRYADSVGHLARDAARYLEGAQARLRCPTDAVRALENAVRDLPGITVEAAAVPAGVTAISADERVLVDNSLAALLARRRADLAIALAARIEGR